MKVAFYYHIPIDLRENKLLLPSYLGVFIDVLASESEHLYLVMHSAFGVQKNKCDYLLKSKNITWINLGLKTPAWHRVLFYRKILKSKLSEVENCDIFLVRSPSPLAAYFAGYLKRPVVCYMIVGDYEEGLNHMKNGGLRQFVVKILLRYINWLFERKILNSNVVVNSPNLYEKYKGLARDIRIFKTTTLTESDFFEKSDTCNGSNFQLLYTGRLDPAKGLFELVEAIAILRREGFPLFCNFVGIETSPSRKLSIKDSLIERARELGVENAVIFHGWKSVGLELNNMYRMADIYVIPSYHEGFPRTIWEALANSLPVIATNVGAIPLYLKNNESAIIIEPKNVEEIKSAILKIIQDVQLRKKLIVNGLNLAKEVTQEKQIKILINNLKDFVYS